MSRPTRVSTNKTFEFNKTIENKLLMCTNANGNNNKFYSIELQTDSTNRFQIFSHYGRINGTVIDGGAFEVRHFHDDESEARKTFNKIVKTKKRPKTRVKDGNTYKENYIEIDVIASSVGSENIQEKGTIKGTIDIDIFKDFNKIERNLLINLEKENVHDILNKTAMKYQGGALQTPLGALTLSHIDKAKDILDLINNAVTNNESDDEIKKLNNSYLSLIPRNLGGNISKHSLIMEATKILQEYDLINQMKTAINLSIQKSMNTNTDDIDVGFNLSLAPSSVAREITHNFEKSRKHRNLSRYKIKNVFKITNKEERIRYEKKADQLLANKTNKKRHKFSYTELDMYHGSRNSNVLSILMNGFYVPPRTAKHTTGRMFGDGVYGADSSTKALNYSAGVWGGQSNKFNNLFCFVTRFAMGEVYETQHSRMSGAPSGYDSIFAKGGADLANNEYIVSSSDQTTMTYLIELE